jgi:hypothetical protein
MMPVIMLRLTTLIVDIRTFLHGKLQRVVRGQFLVHTHSLVFSLFYAAAYIGVRNLTIVGGMGELEQLLQTKMRLS